MSGRVSFTIEKTFDRLAEVTSALSKLAETSVLVGVPEEKGGRKSGEAMNNAALAYIHENGSDRAHIPPRKFMKPGVENAKEAVTKQLKAAAKAAWRGDVGGVDRNCNKAGQEAANSIRAMFTPGNNDWKPVTAATQRAKGKDKTTTLVDTGQLRKSITYVVKED